MWTIRVIVIGIVVAVALSQRERRILQSSPFPRPPSFAGATPLSEPGRVIVRAPAPRPRVAAQPRRRVRPLPGPLTGAVPAPFPAPAPAPPRQAPPRAAPPRAASLRPATQSFLDQDFDYLDDANFILSKPRARPQAFRPVEIKPEFRAQAPAQPIRPVTKAPPTQQVVAAPRRGPPTTFRQEFDIRPQQQQQQQQLDAAGRGPKEPEIQIVRSWSNRNSDGTFSWGYLNTDGSYKNETRGRDCVVKGVYGYIDEATGETLTFPYESGNPCDPDAPDYVFDYDSGPLDIGGRPSAGPQQVIRRRP